MNVDNELFEEFDLQEFNDNKKYHKVHIRNQKRNGKKSITTIQGLKPPKGDIAKKLKIYFKVYNNKSFKITWYKKLLKGLKKKYNCNGLLKKTKDHGIILQLQGDQRSNLTNILVKYKFVKEQNLQTHGI